MSRFQAQAVVSHRGAAHLSAVASAVVHETHIAATTYSQICVRCHMISGEGGKLGPDPSARSASGRPAEEIRAVIEDASAVYGDSGDADLQRTTERRTVRRAGGVSGGAEIVTPGGRGLQPTPKI